MCFSKTKVNKLNLAARAALYLFTFHFSENWWSKTELVQYTDESAFRKYCNITLIKLVSKFRNYYAKRLLIAYFSANYTVHLTCKLYTLKDQNILHAISRTPFISHRLWKKNSSRVFMSTPSNTQQSSTKRFVAKCRQFAKPTPKRQSHNFQLAIAAQLGQKKSRLPSHSSNALNDLS